MTLREFETEFQKLGTDYKTKDVDRSNRALIKRKEDVSCLRDIILEKQESHSAAASPLSELPLPSLALRRPRFPLSSHPSGHFFKLFTLYWRTDN